MVSTVNQKKDKSTALLRPRNLGDRCKGDCCRAFVLSAPWSSVVEGFERWRDGIHSKIYESWLLAQIFKPLGRFKVNPATGVHYPEPRELFDCTMLQANGDCTIYDARPSLCRRYPYGRRCIIPGCKSDAFSACALEMEC